ncbi:ATP-binding cassette domain-containing protein [Enterococcus sp. BWM-S5]|uniref:ATP-binding cassette domain-containing protein n=1 Tax=Enterococcus larvae TaxID=2794352 RepID=A0ABS4CP23_9ENTE|nr:ATP-binding cassette domain-containing protein [Enterococcus larvae]MBP1048200.1 ATP-binding cassette domain-containing protein [Enterococcus larvae]
MIEIKNLTKTFQDKHREVIANKEINLTIKQGELFGLLGQNGSGKTTIVNQIIGLTSIDHGDIQINGSSIRESPKLGRFQCSVQVQGQLSLGWMTPRQVVTLMGELRNGSPEAVKEEVQRLFHSLDIEEYADTPGQFLSGGVKRLTSFCMAVIDSPDYIILDEPTNDVDPIRRKYLWKEIQALTKRGCAVIVVTHNVLEMEQVVDKVAIIKQGRLLCSGTTQEIKKLVPSNLQLTLVLQNNEAAIESPIWAELTIQQEDQLVLSLTAENIGDAIAWARLLLEQKLIQNYQLSEVTLEEVYIHLTKEEQGHGLPTTNEICVTSASS